MAQPHRPTTSDEAEFYRGAAVVLADIIRAHDLPTLAANLCRENGLSLADFERAGVEEYDLAPLRRALARGR